MARRDFAGGGFAILMPVIAGLVLAGCGGGPQGTCTAFDLETGIRSPVGGGTVSQDECFAVCRDRDNLFECQFTEALGRIAVLPMEPVVVVD